MTTASSVCSIQNNTGVAISVDNGVPICMASSDELVWRHSCVTRGATAACMGAILTVCTVCPAVGKITYSYGGEPTAAHATINGDPMITGFDGRSFEFMGEPGSFYSLISEQRHQVRARHIRNDPFFGVGLPTSYN